MPILDILVLITVAVLGYIWGSRGFFSSMLHMLCVLLAGAIALAFYEPIAYTLLGQSWFGGKQWLVNLVWAVSLALPFSLVLVILRVSMDKLVPANLDLDGITNLVGGIACGAVTGVITAGMLVFTLNFVHGAPKAGYFSAPPVAYNNTGSLVKGGGPFIPVDKITAWFYGYTSEATLRTSTPLAKYHPNLPIEGTLLKTNFNEGGSRHVMTPKAFEVQGGYTLGKKAPLSVGDLLAHSFSPGTQTVTRLDGEPINKNDKSYYVEGFVVKFKSGAREREGRIIIGAGQVWLVVWNEQRSVQLQPIAMVSQASLKEGDKNLTYGRWRFDKQDVYIASVGGAEDPPMAFEFLVPRDYAPLALYVKGIRTDVSGMGATADHATASARDLAVKNRSLLAVAAPGQLERGKAKILDLGDGVKAGSAIRVVNALLPGVIISVDNKKNVEIDDERKIIGGEDKFLTNELQIKGVEQKLQVRMLAATEDTVIVQVDVSLNSDLSLVKNQTASEASGPPVLIDSHGQRYFAIGYMYRDATEFDIRFMPGSPIQSKDELPKGGPTSSRQDQQFTLIYRVSANASLVSFAIGDTVVAEFRPQLPIKKH